MSKDTGFDLAAMLADLTDVPESGTGREQIEYIDISLLDDDPNNFYALRDIENLAANIATCGLQQPIRVRNSSEHPNRYTIVSGHRRRAALELLVKEDALKWREAPCIVERDDVSPELQELRLIYANAHTRQLTLAEISDQAMKVEELLYKLAEQGYPFPGRMRDHVAKAVGVNKTKLSNLKVIRENLHNAWQPEFKAGNIGESVALALARMPKEWQWIMFDHWRGNTNKLCHGHVTNAAKKFEALKDKRCDQDPFVTCWANRARLDHIAGMGMYDSSCSGCCMTCNHLRDCQYCCTCAEDEKKRMRVEARVAKAAEKAKEQERIQPELQVIRGVYGRWYQALNQTGLSAEDYLRQCGGRYGLGTDATAFEKYGLDPMLVKHSTVKLPFTANIYAHDVQGLVAAADVLGCSIDWLLGRDVPSPIEELAQPAISGWQTDNPDETLAGDRFVVLTKWSTYGVVKPHVMEWSGDYWDYSGHNAVEAGAIIIGWMPMPEEV